MQKLIQPPASDVQEPRPTPITTILQCSPSSIATTVPLVLWFELEPLLAAPFWRHPDILRELGCYLLVVALLVFMLMYSEYLLVQLTSSLTLSVAGILKELLCILGAIVLFRDTFTPLNTLGFCLCAVGILVYNVHKVRRLRAQLGFLPPGTPDALEAAKEATWGVGDDEMLLTTSVGHSPKQKPRPLPTCHRT